MEQAVQGPRRQAAAAKTRNGARLAAALGTLIALAAGAPAGAGEGPPASSAPLPAALRAHYPPEAPAPTYLIAMLGLGDALSGIVVDLLEGDLDGARATHADLLGRYRAAAQMVPEWAARYPEGPVAALGEALAAGDAGRALQAHAAVGAACHECHRETMVPVQQRFRWGSFAAQVVEDPLGGERLDYASFKRRLAANLTGITHNLRQRQPDNARRQYEGFRARFQALGASCLSCHKARPPAFLGSDTDRLVAELGSTLSAAAIDGEAVSDLTRRIGQGACSGCHLVHVPAAAFQAAQAPGAETRK